MGQWQVALMTLVGLPSLLSCSHIPSAKLSLSSKNNVSRRLRSTGKASLCSQVKQCTHRRKKKKKKLLSEVNIQTLSQSKGRTGQKKKLFWQAFIRLCGCLGVDLMVSSLHHESGSNSEKSFELTKAANNLQLHLCR